MSEPMTYVGRNRCGCIGLLVVDSPDHKTDVGREIARAIRQGMTIERVETAWVRTPACSLSPCADNPACVRAPRPRARRKVPREARGEQT